jgi:hypothetical protein
MTVVNDRPEQRRRDLEQQRECNRLLLAFIETDAWTKAVQPMLAARRSELLDQIASVATDPDRTQQLKYGLQELRLFEEKLSRGYGAAAGESGSRQRV